MRLSLLAFSGLILSAAASPALDHVVHEKREHTPLGWWKHQKAPSYLHIPVRIGLKQNNLDLGHDALMDIANPASENYGKHWTVKEVAETFAPSQESVDEVTSWLAASGISGSRVKQSQSLGWLEFDASVGEAERLFKSEYHFYKHMSGTTHLACSEYGLPANIKEHVDFVTPTVHFDAKLNPEKDNNNRKIKRDVEISHTKRGGGWNDTSEMGTDVVPGKARKVGSPNDGSLPKLSPDATAPVAGPNDLSTCGEYITPACLRALYGIPTLNSSNPANSYGIVEYTPQAYLPSDLDMFFANYSPVQVGDRPIFDSIDGGVLQTIVESFNYNGESDLDLEYALTLVYPQVVTLYQVGDLIGNASFNNFLDGIDGSYCTFEGGDDPTQDGIYPDPAPGGYKGPETCGGFAATNVISTSYGYNEADLTAPYEMRQCQEYMKLGLQGVSILYSSGDYGVAGNGGQCIDPVTLQYNNGSSGIFNPSFPSTCPYVTSVGATQIVPNASVTAPEEACETVIFSGGGFSNVFPIPDYQADDVHEWFAEHPPPYGADRFNNSQQTRGYPDVAANGANYVIAIDGAFSLVYGTSASSPTTGSIITLINNERLNAGKGPVGFLNPTLYAHPEVLNDITSGGNMGCGTPGFESTTGWDPVTGLGTPNYPKMLELFLSLP